MFKGMITITMMIFLTMLVIGCNQKKINDVSSTVSTQNQSSETKSTENSNSTLSQSLSSDSEQASAVVSDTTSNKYKDYLFAFDSELNISGVGKQSTVNMLSGVDDFGRKFDASSGVKNDKSRYVGIFYFTWLGQHGGQQSGIYNITKLLDENPDELWNISNNKTSPTMQYHFWGEPLYGYYNSLDPWVIRRHVELLTMAGVDFLVLDATNGVEYFQVADVLFPILQEYYNKGWNVPKIVYYCNSSSNQVVGRLYEGYTTDPNAKGLKKTGIYKSGLYKDLWFRPNGKPLIIAVTKVTNKSAGWENGNNNLHRVTDQRLLDFFEFKESQWPTVPDDIQNGFPWIEFKRPQTVYTDVINVGVAQHNKLPFSDAALDEGIASQMWGRGFTSQNGANHTSTAIRMGLNFEEQWGVALKKSVKYTFITGWNEWAAIKFVGSPSPFLPGNPERVYFVDTFNEEFSRDVEMMKGGYKDNFYMQMVRNIRTLKYNKYKVETNAANTVIDIRKGLSQWKNVKDVYYAMTNKGNRNFSDFSRTTKYIDNSMINDIEEIRVANDDQNIYFLVKCSANINVKLTSEKFMNLLIDVDGVTGKPFYGYDYIINRKPDRYGNTSIEKYNYERGKYNFQTMNNALFTINGKYMQIKFSKKSLGITGSSFKINFKFADNVNNMLDIQNFYISGTTAPYGRINYTYYGK